MEREEAKHLQRKSGGVLYSTPSATSNEAHPHWGPRLVGIAMSSRPFKRVGADLTLGDGEENVPKGRIYHCPSEYNW